MSFHDLHNDPVAWPILEARARALASQETISSEAYGEACLVTASVAIFVHYEDAISDSDTYEHQHPSQPIQTGTYTAMTDDMYLIEALQLENAALRARIAELIELLSAAQDACDQAEAARQVLERQIRNVSSRLRQLASEFKDDRLA